MKVVLLVILSALQLRAADVALEWDPSPSASVQSYRVYWSTNSGRYSVFSTFPGTARSANITGLGYGRWFFAATAIASNGLESAFSNEVSVNAPLPPPQITRISGPRDALILQSAPAAAGPWKTLAVITSSNQPVQLIIAPRQFFRTIATNLPPFP